MSGLCKELFSGLLKGALRSKEVVSLWVLARIGGLGNGVTKRVLLIASFTCILAVGGAIVAAIHGAIKGQTTETGFSNGAGIGVLAGAIAAIQLMDMLVDGQPLSKVMPGNMNPTSIVMGGFGSILTAFGRNRQAIYKVALLGGIVNGKVFMDWVSSELLKAYQWQVSTLEEISELYDRVGVKGLSQECIQNLPRSKFCSGNIMESCNELCCSICLQELEEGECTREIPICGHLFHLACIDQWLRRQGSCPMCRLLICSDNARL